MPYIRSVFWIERLLSIAELAEHFVSVEVIAEFLVITRRQVLEMARKGDIPAHPIGRGRRKTWRFNVWKNKNHFLQGLSHSIASQRMVSDMPGSSDMLKQAEVASAATRRNVSER